MLYVHILRTEAAPAKKAGLTPGFDSTLNAHSMQRRRPMIFFVRNDDKTRALHPTRGFQTYALASVKMLPRYARRCFLIIRLDYLGSARRGALRRTIIVKGVPDLMAHVASRILFDADARDATLSVIATVTRR
jgi:hypothetical protein